MRKGECVMTIGGGPRQQFIPTRNPFPRRKAADSCADPIKCPYNWLITRPGLPCDR